MRKSRFSASEIVELLREAVEGVPVREICIRIGVSETTFYKWRTHYEGLDAEGVRRLRELEQENSRLRRIVDLQVLHIDVLKAELSGSPGDSAQLAPARETAIYRGATVVDQTKIAFNSRSRVRMERIPNQQNRKAL